jgi:dipeptide/tripeptide permease
MKKTIITIGVIIISLVGLSFVLKNNKEKFETGSISDFFKANKHFDFYSEAFHSA